MINVKYLSIAMLLCLSQWIVACGENETSYTLSSGAYLVTSQESDWEKDACGITSHEDLSKEFQLTVDGNQVTGIFPEKTVTISDEGTFSIIDDDSVEYDDKCTVDLHSNIEGELVDNDALDIKSTMDRTQSADSSDCSIALDDLDALPCQEIHTIHFRKKT